MRQTSVLRQKFLEEVSPDLSGRKNVAHGVRSCEKINNLIPQSGTKAQRLAKNNCFVFFAPLREMLLLIPALFHSFRTSGQVVFIAARR